MRKSLTTIATILVLALAGVAQNPNDALERGFQNPPDSAKPRVWWHWMNGNITKEGIKADLEWMKRAGIGGFQNFDAAFSTPQVVEKRLVYMTPEWKDAFRYAATLADQLGLEMAIAGSPGWSESGGPWVPPSQAMKKYVWSETWVSGGKPLTSPLPKPPSVTGPFQNMAFSRPFFLPGEKPAEPQEHYADSAVIAFRVPEGDRPLTELKPKVTSSGGTFDIAALTDGDLAKAAELPLAATNQKAWIQFEFAQPQTIRAFTLVLQGVRRNPFGPAEETGQQLEASDDGQQFRAVATVPGGGAVAHTVAFQDVTARFFRMTFLTRPAPAGPNIGALIPGLRTPPAPKSYQVAELVLHTGARVNRVEEKAAFAALTELYSLTTPSAGPGTVIAKSDVIDLTSKMKLDGTLEWVPPAGRWVVVRVGYSLLGIMNHPASPEATGFEVDKLSQRAVKAYFDNYLGQYKDAAGELMGKRGLQYMVTDSWEAGTQNWTDDMIAQFGRRRGYDMHPWLPVLTGRIVESAEASDRFLWDFRKTIGELTVENHYDQLTQILRERGMGRYTESHENRRALIADGMEVKRTADIPMSAMWTPRPGETGRSYGYEADIRESASAAHIYGQNIAAAESLTAIGTAWAWSPEALKPVADQEMANGLNRFVIHTSVHQPVSDKVPGLGLGPFGQWFTRHETWAELANPWTTYLARSSYMLQQGKFVADIAYYYGEDSNVTALFNDKTPEIPEGYNFDYVNSDAILSRFAVENGRITTPSGMSYRILALDPHSLHMSLPVLLKIRDLINAGASVVGAKPVGTPSLSDSQAEFDRIVAQMWGSGTGEQAVGKGKVYRGQTLAAALAALGVIPDFVHTKPQPDSTVWFVHRRLSDGDVYWVNNRSNRVETLEAAFRVAGKAPDVWHPDTGRVAPVTYRTEGQRTTVPLRLERHDAFFVVFRKSAAATSRNVPQEVESELATVGGPWDLSFQEGRGAPAKIAVERLGSWSDSGEPGVKYFSGTATYSKRIEAPPAWFQSGARVWLDLGGVKNLAEVSVNGKPLGIVWKAPFRVEATGALKPGANQLEIKVTNLWVNRLIGDQQPGVTTKYTYTTQPFYRAESPLLPSGLLGPVRVVSVKGS